MPVDQLCDYNYKVLCWYYTCVCAILYWRQGSITHPPNPLCSIISCMMFVVRVLCTCACLLRACVQLVPWQRFLSNTSVPVASTAGLPGCWQGGRQSDLAVAEAPLLRQRPKLLPVRPSSCQAQQGRYLRRQAGKLVKGRRAPKWQPWRGTMLSVRVGVIVFFWIRVKPAWMPIQENRGWKVWTLAG